MRAEDEEADGAAGGGADRQVHPQDASAAGRGAAQGADPQGDHSAPGQLRLLRLLQEDAAVLLPHLLRTLLRPADSS